MRNCIAFVNGTVVTMDTIPVCESILIEKGAIAARGTEEEIRGLCRSRGGRLFDLNGCALLPGFHDCHVHMMGTGLNASGIELYDCRSIDEVLQKIEEAAAQTPEDRWIYGTRIDESRLQESRPPTADELDQVALNHPVYIVDRGWHYALVNSRGFEKLDLSPDVPGVRTDSDGTVTGRLHEEANSQAKMAFFQSQSREEREAALRTTARIAVRAGATTINAVEGGELFADSDIPILLEIKDDLPVNVVLWWCTEDIEQIKAAGLPRQGEDILLDGSIGSRTAAFEQPYNDDPSTSGDLYYSDAEVEAMVRAAHLADVQISFHAIGELAIEQALNAFESVLSDHPKADHRHCIDHFGFPRPEHIEKAAELDVYISTQPAFMFFRGGPDDVYTRRLGDERARRGYPLRKFLDAGITVGGGSDSDVTPLDPLLSIHAAVNQPYPETSVTVEEALRMHTVDAAKRVFLEHETGSIEPGKAADLVVLSRNPLEAPEDGLRDIDVVLTMKGGTITYEKEGVITKA